MEEGKKERVSLLVHCFLDVQHYRENKYASSQIIRQFLKYLSDVTCFVRISISSEKHLEGCKTTDGE